MGVFQSKDAVLKHPEAFRRGRANHDGIHTQYAGDIDSPKTDAGNASRTTSTVFFKGKAKGVPTQEAQRLRDIGVVR